MNTFILKSPFSPTGDQPKAIEKLMAGFHEKAPAQTLLGVTGSGKTFTMANVIERMQKPALIISPNKTLAAQLYEEFKEFFPHNAVHYFVSYYDYYQPEAYLPQTDTYIEKDAKINELIDGLRHASTADLLVRNDVLIVASVSCIYGIGDPLEYEKISTDIKVGQKISPRQTSRFLVLLQYKRNDFDPRQGEFRMRGDTVEIHAPSGGNIVTIEFGSSAVERISQKSIALGASARPLAEFKIFPAKHFVTPKEQLDLAMRNINEELKERLGALKAAGKLLAAQRLEERTRFDMEMLKETGYCNGIENYSRHLSFRSAGSPPSSLIDYYRYRFGENFLTFIDESHVTVPQLRGMYAGDYARKQVLVDYGFRLPSAIDNRPLKFAEFNEKIGPVVYVSATPSIYELQQSKGSVAEQLIRPTGLLDPKVIVKKTGGQVKDVIKEIRKRAACGQRSLVLALTKRLAEDIAEYLQEAGVNTTYLHSEIKTLDRPEILRDLRLGKYDALVGINLLREGLDLPEVAFIAILDADKEGFLRNERTLLQIMGRAARNADGEVIMYADTMTDSMARAIKETERRRHIQEAYNTAHGITPTHITKEIRHIFGDENNDDKDASTSPALVGPKKEVIKELEREMKKAAREMNFELAARIRDRIKKYRDG
ncbi:MAG: excinuclease ABC subunit B [Candidatus Sungbacteria bacterium RIFCSPLOWO2_02_FULL_51_17]|uniref:UvrABC system protein B n=1 Tax=Candidatus Sungbacteria bacterium RIFCSPHIGHO2_02_FULL_51_29 TaxID=1802273 RepID=A0A1G2KPE4_9BACT|nr:MAG: excinuclease ABC subunit B [Candidatus Sungbacteria bacterium RIFCSPHIGHO2_01_FULL_51_22]OHA01253.1 MAG: excinuclease ABC subunit B [Candidatus Sungbacteria bacterium RIFCSPHIGHO2_02_FULL_51_29]OHA05867.1 MAG: excinuclease ABC subunit B [Candidatus Sungbacteria bacterium RIFCSPLOWO2_01_FULL_51_34]OHA11354.1 MAG: excinuclease ABC subunit B [Candidatus Sungbacteria bacterium RIFCSPLOWO2_02_FULL_51_17]